jgi:hypothetical protein
MSVAVGWVLVTPDALMSEKNVSYIHRIWGACVLSVVGGVDLDGRGHMHPGVRISALSLLTTALALLVEPSGVGARIAVVGGACGVTIFCIRMRFNHAFSSRVTRAYTYAAQSSMTREFSTVAPRIVDHFAHLVASVVICSFAFSCFRWRYLLNVGPTRAPAWTVLSFLGGGIGFGTVSTVLQVGEEMLGRERGGNVDRRNVRMLVVAMWWTDVVYVVVWVVLEAIHAIEGWIEDAR